MTLFINPDRLRADFEALSAIGAFQDSDGQWGVDRPTFSPAHLQARAWFQARAAEAGLDTQVDSAGNHSAILRAAPTTGVGGQPQKGAAQANAPTLLLGSHLD